MLRCVGQKAVETFTRHADVLVNPWVADWQLSVAFMRFYEVTEWVHKWIMTPTCPLSCFNIYSAELSESTDFSEFLALWI